MTGAPGFDELGDAEKVKYCEAEVAATLGRLDDMIARLAALRTEIDDPDGLVRITLGDDGRVMTLFIDDAVARSLTSLGLEKRLNDLFSAGNEAMWLSRKEFWESVAPTERMLEREGPCGRGQPVRLVLRAGIARRRTASTTRRRPGGGSCSWCRVSNA